MEPLKAGPMQQLPQEGFGHGLQVLCTQPSRERADTSPADSSHALLLQLALWSKTVTNITNNCGDHSKPAPTFTQRLGSHKASET